MDRFLRGIIAGSLGGILMNLWDLFSHYILNFTDHLYLEWTAVMLYGTLPQSTTASIFALLAQLFWVAWLGVMFAYLIPHINSRNYLLKGASWGFLTGFIIFAVPVLFKTPYLFTVSVNSTISNFIGGILWGLTLAQTLRWLDKKWPVKSPAV